MRVRLWLASGLCLLAAPSSYAQGTPLRTTAIPGVVAQGTPVQVIKEGLDFTEGPIAAPGGGIYFMSGGKIMRVDEHDTVSLFMDNANLGALDYDAKGRLIGPGRGKISVILPKGSEAVLADSYDGKPLVAPNDVVIDRKGGIYFSDPGPIPKPGEALPRKPSVYYLTPDGKVTLVADDITRPNGVQLSPDEKTLYVDDTFGDYVYAFDVQPDGSTRNQRQFVKLNALSQAAPGATALPSGLVVNPATGIRSGADGLGMDNAGNLYVCADTGVQVFNPKGERLGVIEVPKPPQNLVFAGPGKKTLYVVGRGGVYKVAMLAEGVKGRAK